MVFKINQIGNSLRRTHAVFALGFGALLMFFFGLTQVEAASLYLGPASGSYTVGSTFTVTVRTDTQGQAVNTAEASITYSAETLELVSVVASPTFNLQAPGSPTKGNGTAYFAGGVPSPGYTGSNGVVGSMTFRARAQGVATVNIASGKVLLNDGNATNALSGSAGARFTISAPPVSAPEVVSASHPSPESWYSKPDIEVSWSRPTGAYGFSFELDQNTDTVPDNVLDTTVTTSQTYTGRADGVWYFHIKARKQEAGSAFGPTVHFRFQIDTAPPEPFIIRLVNEPNAEAVSETPVLEFSTTDVGSGISHYEIYLDDKKIDDGQSSPYQFKKISSGSHNIKVIAYDMAGNAASATLPIFVEGTTPRFPALGAMPWASPISWLLIINIVMLAMIGVLFWLLLRRRRQEAIIDKNQLKIIKTEIDNSLDRLKNQLDSQLSGILQNPSTDKAAKFTSKISKIKKKIDTKLN